MLRRQSPTKRKLVSLTMREGDDGSNQFDVFEFIAVDFRLPTAQMIEPWRSRDDDEGAGRNGEKVLLEGKSKVEAIAARGG